MMEATPGSFCPATMLCVDPTLGLEPSLYITYSTKEGLEHLSSHIVISQFHSHMKKWDYKVDPVAWLVMRRVEALSSERRPALPSTRSPTMPATMLSST